MKNKTTGKLASPALYPKSTPIKSNLENLKRVGTKKQKAKAAKILNATKIFSKDKPKNKLSNLQLVKKKYIGIIKYLKDVKNHWYVRIEYMDGNTFLSSPSYTKRKTLENMLKNRISNYEQYDIKILGK